MTMSITRSTGSNGSMTMGFKLWGSGSCTSTTTTTTALIRNSYFSQRILQCHTPFLLSSFDPDFTLLQYGAIMDFEVSKRYVTELPYPLKHDSFPVSTSQESLLVDFPSSFFLSRVINISIALLGFLLAAFLLYRFRRSRLFRRVSFECCVYVASR